MTDSKLREACGFQPANIEITAHLESIPTNIWERESMETMRSMLKVGMMGWVGVAGRTRRCAEIEIEEMVAWLAVARKQRHYICECLSGELMNFRHTVLSSAPVVEQIFLVTVAWQSPARA